jgi:hypothetical protein
MTNEDFQLHVIETLATLDTKMDSLVGNGQPGRVGQLEADVKELSKSRWYRDGMMAGVATAVSTAVHFIFKH